MLLEFIAAQNLHIINAPDSIPTFENSKYRGWPDVTLVTDGLASLRSGWEVSELISLSDHKYIFFHFDARIKIPNFRRRLKTNYGGYEGFKKRIVKNQDRLELLLEGIDEFEVFNRRVEKMMNILYKMGKGAFGTRAIGTGSVRFCWWNSGLSVKRRRLRAMRRRFQRTQDVVMKGRYRVMFCRERAIYKKEIRMAKALAWRTFCSGSRRVFDVQFKVAFGKKRGGGMMSQISDRTDATYESEIRGILEHFFPIVDSVTDLDKNFNNDCLRCRDNYLPFTKQEVLGVLSGMATGKAPGPDAIDLFMIKILQEACPDFLTKFYNICLYFKSFPDFFKRGEIVLIGKKGREMNKHSDFRPICLLPVMGKILEKLILGRLLFHLQNCAPINENQFGFKKGLSTEHAVFRLLSKLKDFRQNYKYCVLVCLDVKGAFDSLDWRIILDRVRQKKCPEYIFRFICSYLSDRYVFHRSSGVEVPVTLGCPQGSCFGPILWSIVADHILEQSWDAHTHIQAYADDFAILVAGNSRRNLEENAVISLATFSRAIAELRLEISVHKTTALLFGNLLRKPTLKIQDTNIQFKANAVYLGVTLNDKLSWLPHIQACKAKACAAASNIISMMGSGWGISSELYKKWYLAVIQRIIVYAASIWAQPMHSHVKRNLLSIQRIFLLRITRAYRNTSTDALLVASGLLPLPLVATMEARNTLLIRLRTNNWSNDVSPDIIERETLEIDPHPAMEDIGDALLPSGPEHKIMVFTDGSKYRDQVGSAFVVFRCGTVIYTWQRRLCPFNSVFQAELLAILQSLKWLVEAGYGFATIFSDSLSSLALIGNPCSGNTMIKEIRKILREYPNCFGIRWIRAHMGCVGNELADRLAKEAAIGISIQDMHLPMPKSYIKRKNREEAYELWQEEWDLSEKGRDLYKFFPRVDRKICIGDRNLVLFFTAHGPFPAFLFRHKIIDSPLCACGEIGDPLHYACHCPLTSRFHVPGPAGELPMWRERALANNWFKGKLVDLMNYLNEHELELRA